MDLGLQVSGEIQAATTQGRLIDGWSIEVLPRTAAKVKDFRSILPSGTRIFLAHIDGTSERDMVATARRLCREGFAVTPHIPARSLADKSTLGELLSQYRHEADVTHALLLAGGAARQRGTFASSLDLIETGLFDKTGFQQLHFAGHPEGNRDIDPDGLTTQADAVLLTKQAFSMRTDARIVLTTQFVFEAFAVLHWANRLAEAGIDLPIHVGLPGPAKLQTLMKYALTCGVGASISVLQKRARDVRRLLLPFEPDEIANELEAYKALHPECRIEQFHMFPLGGIEAAAGWCSRFEAISRT